MTEAKQAARLLTEHKINFDHCFTSVLKRAIRTLWIVLDEMDLMWLPVSRNWRLNEPHYGALQGRNKEEMRREVGKEQVHLRRRGYAVRPPPLHESDPRNPMHERKYAEMSGISTCGSIGIVWVGTLHEARHRSRGAP